ncbi:MAG: acetyltransferase [Desulfomonilaceae bacterium]|nr:acetyltransferase [Desulfomonilaceae bacterium]
MSSIVIFGIGDFAEVVHASLKHDGRYEVCGFTIHEKYLSKTTFQGLDVVPFERVEEAFPSDRFAMFVAVGYRGINQVRAELYSLCKRKNYRMVTYVSPRASLIGNIELGENCFIGENTVIRTSSRVGNNVIVGACCYMGQNTVIRDHCFISQSASLAGNLTIDEYAFIGPNSTIRDRIHIGSRCVIGAGAVVLRDTVPNGVYRAREAELLPVPSSDLKKL